MTFWGIFALLSCGFAVLGGSLSAVLPESVFAGLHATRLTGASVNEMHSELASLEDEQARLRAANSELSTRFEQEQRNSGTVRQRVAALEDSVPRLTEAMNSRTSLAIDPSIVTGSIGTPAAGFTKSASPGAESDEVKVTHKPLLPTTAALVGSTVSSLSPVQPMPTALHAAPSQDAETITSGNAVLSWARTDAASMPAKTASVNVGSLAVTAPSVRADVIAEGAIDPPADASSAPASSGQAPSTTVANAETPAPQPSVTSIGIAIGPAVQPAGALAAWQGLAARVGILLVGTSPLLAEDPAGSGAKVLVAGPLTDVTAAARLCTNIDRVGINCTPMPYVGSPLAPADAAQ